MTWFESCRKPVPAEVGPAGRPLVRVAPLKYGTIVSSIVMGYKEPGGVCLASVQNEYITVPSYETYHVLNALVDRVGIGDLIGRYLQPQFRLRRP